MAERLTFVGHSTVLLELAGSRILTDPVLRERILHIRRHAGAVAPETTRDIDAILISHLHADHLDPPSLRRVGEDVRIIAPVGAARMLRRRGFRVVEELAAGAATSVGEVTIQASPVRHDGRRYPVGRPIDALAYAIRGRAGVFFAGDTDRFDMSHLTGFDAALLPIAGWGPHLRGHMDPAGAAQAAAAMRPRIAIPIHWATMLRLGLGHRAEEILVRPAEKFAAEMAEVAPEVEARILQPGEATELG
ncbi:MAG: MBL fold metallo-hydrolase [Actinomycetota bacterium]|nr:MBL fold metallo-hydrolase [Actinomycetota bacterium]